MRRIIIFIYMCHEYIFFERVYAMNIETKGIVGLTGAQAVIVNDTAVRYQSLSTLFKK